MPIYKYEALKNGKNVVKGEIVANDLKDAREIIRKKGLVPTKVTENIQIKGITNGFDFDDYKYVMKDITEEKKSSKLILTYTGSFYNHSFL